MGKLILDLKAHIKYISWALVLVYIFLGFIVLIYGESVGYHTVTWIAIGLALLITIIFTSIVFGELLWALIANLFRRLVDREK